MGNDVDNKNKSVILTYTNIKHEMKAKTEEFSTKHLTMGPQLVWAEVKRWANEEYGGNWSGLKEHQVTELARKCHKKLGLCDAIGTIENTPDYNKMTNQDSRGYTGDFSGMQKKKMYFGSTYARKKTSITQPNPNRQFLLLTMMLDIDAQVNITQCCICLLPALVM